MRQPVGLKSNIFVNGLIIAMLSGMLYLVIVVIVSTLP